MLQVYTKSHGFIFQEIQFKITELITSPVPMFDAGLVNPNPLSLRQLQQLSRNVTLISVEIQ